MVRREVLHMCGEHDGIEGILSSFFSFLFFFFLFRSCLHCFVVGGYQDVGENKRGRLRMEIRKGLVRRNLNRYWTIYNYTYA